MTPQVQCPRCSSALRPLMVKGVGVHLCDNCGNFLMDKASFDDLLGYDVSTMPDVKLSDDVSCPGCGGRLREGHVHGEEVNFCNSCNIVHSDHDSFSNISLTIGGDLEDIATGIDVGRNVENAKESHRMDSHKVDDVFVLYRNGILLSSYTTDVSADIDTDVLGAMMTAIMEFVRTCFRSLGSDSPLSSIKIGEKEIAFEHGEFIVMAITLKGNLDAETRDAISVAIKKLEGENREFLDSWNGCLGDIKDIALSLQSLLVPVR